MPTVQTMIDTILKTVPGAPIADTVDVLKSGDPQQEVKGVVTTFLATQTVLQKAIDLGANFVITHEPTYYTHVDKIDWLQNDPVYRAKRKLIDDHHLTIWRFHDHWHRHQPDGITTGALKALGWEQYADDARPPRITLPPTTLADLTAYVRQKLGTTRPLVIGEPDMQVSKVVYVAGSPGGEFQIELLRGDIDVMIVGETPEWQTPEYVRDARSQGQRKALITIGHEASEEAGMAYLVEWLQPQFPGLPITHVPSGDPYAQGE
ncbi:MAG TPA: Nif3-like dinuclear metal center hexameric protein [Phototrophicaceae bacterium]|nr:Nif3-like dinuclear metal center hexameric protein [Phototrophicaceae bacterium]